MRDMDHTFDITVAQFVDTLTEAQRNLDRVHPEDLREPLGLWFHATTMTALTQSWTSLLGRPVVAVWNAARAILDQPSTKDRDS